MGSERVKRGGSSLWGHVSADSSQDGLPFLVTIERPAGDANCTEKGQELSYKQPQALHLYIVQTYLRPSLQNLITEQVHVPETVTVVL